MKFFYSLCLFFFPIIIFFSCKEITFQTPQPKGKKELTFFPEALQGKYKGDDHRDTLEILKNGFFLGEDFMELSDSLVLKMYKGFYFLNMRENTFSSSRVWNLVVMHPSDSALTVQSFVQNENNFNAFVKNIAELVPVDSVKVQDQFIYQIDPKPRELIKIINKNLLQKVVFKKLQKI